MEIWAKRQRKLERNVRTVVVELSPRDTATVLPLIPQARTFDGGPYGDRRRLFLLPCWSPVVGGAAERATSKIPQCAARPTNHLKASFKDSLAIRGTQLC